MTKLFSSMPNQRKILLSVALFLFFEMISYLLIDRRLALFFHQPQISQSPWVGLFRSMTDLGKGVWYLGSCGLTTLLCAFLARGKDVPQHLRRLFSAIGARALFVFVAVAASGVIADIIKPVLGRARPALFFEQAVYGFAPFTFAAPWNAMPSGHATTSFTLAAVFCVLFPKGRWLWLGFGLSIAASRVMIDAHYLSDVVAGSLLGCVTVTLMKHHGINNIVKIIFPIDESNAIG